METTAQEASVFGPVGFGRPLESLRHVRCVCAWVSCLLCVLGLGVGSHPRVCLNREMQMP